jgi:hypothetical protein
MSVPPFTLDCISWCYQDLYDQFVNLFPEEMSSIFLHVFFFFFTAVPFNHDTLSDSCVISLPITLLLSVLHLDYRDTCFN